MTDVARARLSKSLAPSLIERLLRSLNCGVQAVCFGTVIARSLAKVLSIVLFLFFFFYLRLCRNGNSRCLSFFQKFPILRTCCYGFTLSSQASFSARADDMRRRYSAMSTQEK